MSSHGPRLIIMRHGETEWSKSGQHTGVTDIPLTSEGEDQARAAAGSLHKLALNDPLVIASPRKRAQRTAQLAGLHVDRISEELCEWNYGEYEGITTAKIRETVPGWTVFTHDTPGGETPAQVGARADSLLAKVRTELESHDVVLVGHGHFSRVLIVRWLGLDVLAGQGFAMGPAAHSVLGYDRGIPQLFQHNLS